MPASVVIGTQWGDEGKGKVVDLLAADADVVVRFHGGNNAGHTLVVDGEKTVLNLIPAGVLHPGRICMLGPGMVIDPEVLVAEIDALRARGYLAEDRWLRVSEQAHLFLPYHRAIAPARERLRARARSGPRAGASGPRTRTRSRAPASAWPISSTTRSSARRSSATCARRTATSRRCSASARCRSRNSTPAASPIASGCGRSSPTRCA